MKQNSSLLWLIMVIVALPQLSETIYTPSLPDIASSLLITENAAQSTLTIYLLGFAIGVLIWGVLSDKYGRKPCLLFGLGLFLISCIACWIFRSFESLMLFRFIQAVGASAGSVLGQAIARDAITLQNRGKIFSTISIAIAFAPAIGPIIGSLTSEHYGWASVFLTLSLISILIMIYVNFVLSETNRTVIQQSDLSHNFLKCLKKMLFDRQVLGLGFLVGGLNGIMFGYFSEAPFYFIEMLGMSKYYFGLMCSFIVVPLALGGLISRNLHQKFWQGKEIINLGCLTIITGSILLLILTYSKTISTDAGSLSIILGVSCVSLIISGVTMVMPNCLSHALEDYKELAGTAASLFGFYYYTITALVTALISYMHNGTLYQMPFFFLIVGLTMFMVLRTMIYTATHRYA